jgi:hypothetical protein
LRTWTPPAKSLSAIPSCAGLMTRLACARAKQAGIDLPPLLQRVRLSVQDIEDESIRLNVATQIQSLNVLAEALNDRLLGFHLGQDLDLRRTGFLYYAAASSDLLGHALQGLARCATTLNEGVDTGVAAVSQACDFRHLTVCGERGANVVSISPWRYTGPQWRLRRSCVPSVRTAALYRPATWGASCAAVAAATRPWCVRADK